MRDKLLGFLLGALDEAEHECVRQELERDEALEQDLATLERRIAPLSCDAEHHHAPAGLAQRTCSFVSKQESRQREQATAQITAQPTSQPTSAQSTSAALAPASGRFEQAMSAEPRSSRWGIGDYLVAAGVALAAAVLFFPAIVQSRHDSRIAQCRDNLRQIGTALFHHSEMEQGYFPRVPTEGNQAAAGIYAPILAAMELAPSNSAFVCPSSELAERSDGWIIPTLEEIDLADGARLVVLRREMGGSYGYSLGYVREGRYYSSRNLGREYFALLADAPSSHLPGRQSANHGGRGQNVLFESGRVAFLVRCDGEGCSDAIYINHNGVVAAGVDQDDIVIGGSSASPLLRAVGLGR